MTPSVPWLTRLAEVTGTLDPPRAIGSGVYLVQGNGGRAFVAKRSDGALDEADGLRRLRLAPGAPPVPAVVLAEPGLLVTEAVEQTARTVGHEEDLGRSLARLHEVPFEHWGGGSSWVGACRVDPSPQPDGAAYFGSRWRELSARCGLEAVVERVITRLAAVLPPGGPALVHGDLWWGNVLFGSDGRTWLIDPSVHGGHPEEDLAMLALFGPVPDRLVQAYTEVRPLPPGWEERTALFQLSPLLVHSVVFGGSYRAQAEAVARRFG